MYCPKCGSNQGEGKRFCTVCGTNLAAVSQALTGHIPPPNYYAPPVPHPFEIERQRAMASGIRFSIAGGAFLAWQFFGFIFSGFQGSPFGFKAFIAFILLGIGIPKIIASRPPDAANSQAPASHHTRLLGEIDSQPVISAPPAVGSSVPQTSELEPIGRRIPSVTDEETRHLPHS